MYNFLKFIDWPRESSLVTSKNYEICIVGKDPFGATLDIFKTKKINNKNIHISYLKVNQQIKNCHIVFIAKMSHSAFRKTLKMAENIGILTVSSIQDFAQKGGVIAFILHNNKLRFNINRTVALKKGLQINAKLLELAISIF